MLTMNPYLMPGISKKTSIKQIIINAVCEVYKVDYYELYLNRYDRHKEWIRPRQFIMYFMHEHGYSFSACGLVFQKDHTTALSAYESITGWLATDKEIRERHKEIINKINTTK